MSKRVHSITISIVECIKPYRCDLNPLRFQCFSTFWQCCVLLRVQPVLEQGDISVLLAFICTPLLMYIPLNIRVNPVQTSPLRDMDGWQGTFKQAPANFPSANQNSMKIWAYCFLADFRGFQLFNHQKCWSQKVVHQEIKMPHSMQFNSIQLF